MNVLETEWWTMAVPPEWWAESHEDSILIGDQDDVGCIQISMLHREAGEFEADEVAQIAQRESEQPLDWEPLELGEFSGVTSRYTQEEVALREWYVARKALLLFITYSCDAENAGMDDSAVDELLDTLIAVESED